ncbi:hypothetical protein KI387_012300, partial [Taxus chinensis]
MTSCRGLLLTEKCWDVHTEINESNKNTPKILESRPEKGFCSMERLMKFNSNSPQSSGMPCKQQSMMEGDKEWERRAELGMRTSKLMEEQADIIYEKCCDAHAEIAESNKNTPKVCEGSPEKNASSVERPMDFNSISPQSAAKARDGNSCCAKFRRLQSMLEDNKEWEGGAKPRIRLRKLMEEQEDKDQEIYGKEERKAMPYSASPPIIQAGGVASYHPVYSSSPCRPRSFRYRRFPDSVIPIPKRRLGQPVADIQKTEESRAEAIAEGSSHGSKTFQGSTKSEAIEANMDESHYPQLVQETHNLEKQRRKITFEDAEQPQECAESDDPMENKSNSLIDYSIDTSTVSYRTVKPALCMIMLPLFLFLALPTAYPGFGFLNTSYGGAKHVQDHKPHMYSLPVGERMSPSQKIEEFFSWLLEPVLHSEYMGRLKNSSGTVSGKFVDSVYLCSGSAFSYVRSCTGCMTEEVCGKFINFCRRFLGNLLDFLYQDLLVSVRSAAHAIQGLCKSYNSNKIADPMNTSYPMESSMNNSAPVVDNQVSEQETNQGSQGNSSTRLTDFILEPDHSTIDAENRGYQEMHDQMVAEDKEDSTFSEENVSEGSHSSSREMMEAQQTHLNAETVVIPVEQDSFNAPTTMLGLEHKSSWILCKFVAIAVITLVSIGGGSLYLGWGSAHEMKGTKQRNKHQRRKKQFEGASTMTHESPALGSCIQYSSEFTSTPTAVRRSLRIQ